jgi:hypothetical protein
MYITIIIANMDSTDKYMMSLFDDDYFNTKIERETKVHKAYSGFFRSSFLNSIYFHIKNSSYEISIMWCLIITTIILLLSLVIKDAEDEEEVLRVL